MRRRMLATGYKATSSACFQPTTLPLPQALAYFDYIRRRRVRRCWVMRGARRFVASGRHMRVHHVIVHEWHPPPVMNMLIGHHAALLAASLAGSTSGYNPSNPHY